MSTKGLTRKHALFVREYLVDLNAAQAYIRAGYSPKTAETCGPRLLRNAQVAAAIDAAMAERAHRVEVTADEVIRELKRIALVDIRKAYTADGRLKPIPEMPDEIAAVLAGVETEELWDVGGDDDGARRMRTGDVRKVKFWPKVQALELLGKHLKLFTDKLELKTDESFAEMLRLARERAQRR